MQLPPGGIIENVMADPTTGADGSGVDAAQQRFAPCVKKYGTDNAKARLDYKGYQAASSAADTAGIDTSSVLALWDNEGALRQSFGPPGPKGEIGPAQIRPGVVQEEQKKDILPQGWNSDLTANLTAGALYYDRLSDHYSIPEDQVAAAYNGGPYNYKRNRAAQEYQKSFDTKKSAFDQLINCINGVI